MGARRAATPSGCSHAISNASIGSGNPFAETGATASRRAPPRRASCAAIAPTSTWPPAAAAHRPRRFDDCRSEQVAVGRGRDLAHRDADLQVAPRAGLVLRLAARPLLERDRRRDRRRRRVERGHGAVAEPLDDAASGLVDDVAEQRVEPSPPFVGPRVAQADPLRGRPHDVAEQHRGEPDIVDRSRSRHA